MLTEKTGEMEKNNIGYVSEKMHVMPLRSVVYMDMETINRLLDEISEDRSVPKNIRNSIMEARQYMNSNVDMAVRINSAVSILDEISNDPNIPVYTRTQIWNIVSMLEVIDEKAKAEQ